jgi:uncharacterized protein YdcH (DUF465 family)
MFHEYREIISKMKTEDAHFQKQFDRHNELNDKIDELEVSGGEHTEHFKLETMKKEKLKLKDDIYNMIIKYKKANNL